MAAGDENKFVKGSRADNDIKVRAFDATTGAQVGEYNSIAQASKKLYIRSGSTIHHYIFGVPGSTLKRRRGVKSYKGNKVYRFELIKENE